MDSISDKSNVWGCDNKGEVKWERKAFSVRVRVHQGSVLSPLLFIIVLEALSRVQGRFAHGIAWCRWSRFDGRVGGIVIGIVEKWKNGMEAKGLRVNAGTTKVMQCRVSRVQSEDSGKHPCGVWRKGVGDNSFRCVECLKWVHQKCSGISGKLKE